MKMNIAVLPGDGVGKEIMPCAESVLAEVCGLYGHELKINRQLIGGSAYNETGSPLPEQTVKACLESDAVLLGAVGGPDWTGLPHDLRPEAGLLAIRSRLGLFANLRPAVLFPELISLCPLKNIPDTGFDIMIVRELTGGIYFGRRGSSECSAFDTEEYSYDEIKRITETAVRIAGCRKNRITSVDKANVLASSVLWRNTVTEICRKHNELTAEHLYVDNAAMQLIRRPETFDVILTSNMFGDILSDEAAMLTGSIGMLPSASLGTGTFGLYEPVHGSAPDIAGKQTVNPCAMILSAAMMLRYTFGLERESVAIENAVRKALADGVRTADIAESTGSVSTEKMTESVLKGLK